MPWWRESDTFADEEIWGALAKGNADAEDRLQAAYCRLKAKASQVMSNGYLSEQKALQACRGRARVLELLCSAPLADRPPLLHRKGDVCDCIGEWVDGYDFLIHAFLLKNPARAETERERAMKADRRDARLRALVYERDAGCCRYCRSGPLPKNMGRAKDRRKVRSFDHVDPDRPASPDGGNYVLACDRCNAEKGHRTPDEADMVLLPEPTTPQRLAWLAQDLTLFDRDAIANGSRSDRGHDGDPDCHHDRGPDRGPFAVETPIGDGEPMADLRPGQANSDRDRPPARSVNPLGSGRAAGDGGPLLRTSFSLPPRGQPVRTSAHPDVYSRRSRYGGWPPGSVPAPGRDVPDWPEGSEVCGALQDPNSTRQDQGEDWS